MATKLDAHTTGGVRAPSANRVAVLPFENRARDTSLTLLAEGLADQINTNLGQVQRLQLTPPSSVRYVLEHNYHPAWMALNFVAVGDKEAALRWFARGIETRTYILIFARVDPMWDPLRSDPRFAELLERIRPLER